MEQIKLALYRLILTNKDTECYQLLINDFLSDINNVIYWGEYNITDIKTYISEVIDDISKLTADNPDFLKTYIVEIIDKNVFDSTNYKVEEIYLWDIISKMFGYAVDFLYFKKKYGRFSDVQLEYILKIYISNIYTMLSENKKNAISDVWTVCEFDENSEMIKHYAGQYIIFDEKYKYLNENDIKHDNQHIIEAIYASIDRFKDVFINGDKYMLFDLIESFLK